MRSSAFEREALSLYAEMCELPAPDRRRWLLTTCDDVDLRAAVAALAQGDAAAGVGLPTQPPEPRRDRDPDTDPDQPERIGGFRIASEIGRGGMGIVYLGERDDGLFDHRVAIKLIRTGFASEAASEQFARERRILARLRHPHIAQIIDGGVTTAGEPYIVMEFIRGVAITHYCGIHTLDLAARLDLFRQMAAAIDHAHRNLIVHADIKPVNVIVEEGFGVKLLDFGIARLLEDEEAPVRTGYTKDYASPARVAGQPARPADDIFASGVVLRELVTGVPGADADLLHVAAKAAANDAAYRYGTMAECLEDLSRWQAHRPTSAAPPSRRHAIALSWRRHRIGYAAVVAVLVTLTLFAAVVSQLYLASEHQRRLADRRFTETRQIADYLIDQVEPELARAGGTLPLRRELVARTGDYLHTLESDRATATTLQRDIASGYLGLARVYGLDPSGGLGDFTAAERALAHAQALLRAQAERRPDDVALMTERAQAELVAGSAVFVMPDAAHLLPASAALHRAQVLLKQRLARAPNDVDARLALWRADIMLGRASSYLGTAAQQRSTLKAELENAQMPVATYRQRAERDFLLDASLLMLGEAYQGDDPSAATSFYSRLIDHVDAMRDRGDSDWQNEFLQSSALAERATLFDSHGMMGAAQRDYQRSLDQQRQILTRDNNHEIMSYRTYVEYRFANLLGRVGAYAHARALLDKATAWARADAAGPAGSGTARRMVAMLSSERGWLEGRTGNRRAACAADRQALAAWEALARAHATLPEDAAPSKPFAETSARLAKQCAGHPARPVHRSS